MTDSIDPALVQAQLSSPPFATIEGVINVRSLGNYPALHRRITRPNYAFRSAQISDITSTGKAQLRNLGIKKVFDLRADIELVKFSSPSPDLGDGIDIQRIPIFKEEDYSPQELAIRSKLYASGDISGILKIYNEILDGGAVAFRAVFEHIRDKPDDGFLFHCTAGKDRTGVLSALILKVAGVDDDDIASDYELTTLGLEPQRATMMAKLLTIPQFSGNIEAARNALSCRREAIPAILKVIEDNHGGVAEYLQDKLGFSLKDVEIIRSNLLL